jgi:hypothetical protein
MREDAQKESGSAGTVLSYVHSFWLLVHGSTDGSIDGSSSFQVPDVPYTLSLWRAVGSTLQEAAAACVANGRTNYTKFANKQTLQTAASAISCVCCAVQARRKESGRCLQVLVQLPRARSRQQQQHLPRRHIRCDFTAK